MRTTLSRPERHLAAVIIVIIATAAVLGPSQALACHRQEMILQDDQPLIYALTNQVIANLQRLMALGVDRPASTERARPRAEPDPPGRLS